MKYQLIYFLEGQEEQVNETIERDNMRQVKYYCSKLNFLANVSIWDHENNKGCYYARNQRSKLL